MREEKKIKPWQFMCSVNPNKILYDIYIIFNF